MPYRSYRGSRRRNGSMPRTVVQSFKKVINIAPASEAAGAQAQNISIGTDSVAAGQTTAVDAAVPTGAVIKSITIQASYANLVAVASFTHWSIQRLHSGQATNVPANAVGGNPQRNQVMKQGLVSIGKEQNRDIRITFKVPAKYGRVREGDFWQFVTFNSAITTAVYQFIYKFYR